jgi:hypothetical protein
VLKLIRDKAKGKEVVLPEAPGPSKVADLMEALRQSIEATKKGTRPAEAAAQADGQRRSSGSARKSTKAKGSTRARATQKGRKLKKAS